VRWEGSINVDLKEIVCENGGGGGGWNLSRIMFYGGNKCE
jgi:hypothetical protein